MWGPRCLHTKGKVCGVSVGLRVRSWAEGGQKWRQTGPRAVKGSAAGPGLSSRAGWLEGRGRCSAAGCLMPAYHPPSTHGPGTRTRRHSLGP